MMSLSSCTVFCDVESVPCVSLVTTIFLVTGISSCTVIQMIHLAQLIREIRSDYYYVPGFKKCNLEYIVNYTSTF